MSNLLIIYPGRFQPFHKGHQSVYSYLCGKFSKDDIFIASSNKQTKDSPLNFKQKQFIAINTFNIPNNKFIECKVPYVPDEILKSYNKDKVSLILALGSKDSNRLTENKQFDEYNEQELLPASKKTYVLYTPMFCDNISATAIRQIFTSNLDIRTKKRRFIKLFGFFEQEIFKQLCLNYINNL